MSASNAKSAPLRKSSSPISSRTSALAKVLRSQMDIPEYEEQPQVLEQLVNEEGIEGAILHAKAFPTSRKWSLVTSQLRSMLHRLDSDKMGFLELWLEICGHKEETLRALYEKEESFIHSVWKRDVGTNLFQIFIVAQIK